MGEEADVAMPHSERANVPREKVTEYLLSADHPTGRHKARLFHQMGYTKAQASLFVRHLKGIASTGVVVNATATSYGTKYTVEGILETPAGGEVVFRTVWIIEPGGDRPRLVTAYPVKP